VDWTSALQDGRMVRDVTTSYKVTFKDVDTTERPGVLRAPETVFTGDDLEINPRSDGLYHVVNVPVSVPGEFPWDLYPHVEVRLRYTDPANGIALDDVFLLEKGASEKRWPLFVRDASRIAFDYQLVFRAQDHRDWSQDWVTTTNEQVLVRDPRSERRTVHIVPAVSWDVVSTIFVDVSYRDDANGVRKEETFVFENTPEGKARKTFSVALANPDHRVVVYAVKMLLADNSLVELPASTTLGKEIFLRADMRGHRVITLQPDGTDFGARRIDRVKVAAKYDDTANGLSFASEFVFRSAGDTGFFEFDYVDPQRGAYEVQATTVFADGFTIARDPERFDTDMARIKVG
jgi:hypothetical protein